MKTDISSPVVTAEFSKFADILSVASSFRIWNSSPEIPLPPLSLLVVVFPKAHLTSHSRISDSRRMITPLGLSLSLRPFFLCVFLPLLLNIFFYYAHTISVFIVPIFAWNVPLVSQVFLKRSLVFPILLFSSISLHCSLKKSFLSLHAILWNSSFRWVYLSFSPLPLASLLFSAICETSSDNQFACCIYFSWRWFWILSPVQCHEPPSIVLQAHYQI